MILLPKNVADKPSNIGNGDRYIVNTGDIATLIPQLSMIVPNYSKSRQYSVLSARLLREHLLITYWLIHQHGSDHRMIIHAVSVNSLRSPAPIFCPILSNKAECIKVATAPMVK